ncbi:MAG: copper resistance protein B, partial [Candidatus Thiodiazotropha sp.]
VKREFAPYIGVNWSKRFGDTADYAREEGEDISDLQWLVGVRAWY